MTQQRDTQTPSAPEPRGQELDELDERELDRLSMIVASGRFTSEHFMDLMRMIVRVLNARKDTIARLQREAEGLRRERDEARRDAEGCVCKGNWRAILNETRHLIGYRFKDHKGKVFSFFGLVDGQDDYYYGMFGGKELRLLSCVGSIEGHGYTLTGDAALPHPDSETHGP